MIETRNIRPVAWRSLSWAMLGMLLAVRVVLALLNLPKPLDLVVTDTLTYLLPIALSLPILYVLTFRTLSFAEHRLWGLLAIANTLTLVSETHWTWYAAFVDSRGPDIASPVHLLNLIAMVAFLFVLVSMSRFVDLPPMARLRLVLDVVALCCTAFAFIFVFWTLPALLDVPRGGIDAAVIIALYPVAGMLILASTAMIFAGWKTHRWRSWERLTAMTLAVFAAGVSMTPLWYPSLLAGEDLGPSWFTTVAGAGYLLLSVAAVYRLTSDDSEAIAEPWPIPHAFPRWIGRVYPVLLSMALPALGYFALTGLNDRAATVLMGTTVALAGLLVMRSWLSTFIRVGQVRQSLADPMSGPLDRDVFNVALSDQVSHATDRGSTLSLVVFAAPYIARYDSVLGHSVSDAALSRVVSIFNEADCGQTGVYRLNADLFAVICDRVGPHEAASLARRAWLRLRHELGDVDAAFHVVAGVASFPEHALDAPTLFGAARTACVEASGSDSEPVVVFDEARGVTSDEVLLERARMRTLRETVRTLAHAVDVRDPATRDHSVNVAELATALAQVLDLPDERVQVVGLAALMHDVGKVGIRDELLRKAGPLTQTERAEFEMHPVLGEMILTPAHFGDILPLVRHHHECWDGSGYPDGLAGHSIPLEARILSVCDMFDVLASGRSNRQACSTEQALAAIERNAGTQLDPVVAAAFIRLVRKLGSSPAESALAPETPSRAPAIDVS